VLPGNPQTDEQNLRMLGLKFEVQAQSHAEAQYEVVSRVSPTEFNLVDLFNKAVDCVSAMLHPALSHLCWHFADVKMAFSLACARAHVMASPVD
jgi:hypothetical protein